MVDIFEIIFNISDCTPALSRIFIYWLKQTVGVLTLLNRVTQNDATLRVTNLKMFKKGLISSY